MRLKEWMSFFLSLLMIFAFLGFWNVQRVSAADVTDKAKFEDLKITVAETGSESTGTHGESETQVALKFSGKFSFPNVTVNEIKDGDYFIVKAPDNLSLKDETMDLIDTTSNTKMGTVQVDNSNHQLKFTFNAEVENKQNIRGDFVAQAVETVTKEEKTVTYVIPGGKTQQITYIVKKYPKASIEGELLNKYSSHHTSLPQINYYMKFNRSKTDMGNHVVEIKDDLSKGAFANYIESSFTLYEAEYKTTDTNDAGLTKLGKEYGITTDPAVYQADSDHKALLTYTNGKRSFVLRMPTNMGTKSFLFRYSTTSPADGSTVTNTAQYLIDNQPQLIWKTWGGTSGTQKETTINTKSVKSAGASVTADIAGRIKIVKYDEADANVKLEGVVFEIFEKDTKKLVDTVTTNKDGIAMSKVLKDGKYIVKEKTPKPGYIANSKEFEVEMKGGEGVPLSISNKRETVDFEATKTWVNGKATDYKEVKLGLYVRKKGESIDKAQRVTGNYTPKVTESNGVYTYKWEKQLPKYDVDGKTELVYSVRELRDQTDLPLKEGDEIVAGGNNYGVSYNKEMTKVTNTYLPPQTEVTAKKVWKGGIPGVRPTTYFKLYRTLEGGTEEAAPNAKLEKVPTTDGTVKWTGLPATDQNAKKYTYSVKEVDEEGNLIVDPIDGYTPSQIDPLTIKNTYSASPAEAVIEAKKKLEGRPTELQDEEFEFILKDNDGKEVQRIKNKGTNADGTGRVVFKPIKFTKEGHYQYTIVEAKAGETENGITYDNRTVPVIVHVYDNGRGQLVAWVEKFEISQVALPAADFSTSAPGSNLVPPISGAINTITDAGIQTFTNTYKATKAKAPVSATKSFINKNTDKPIQLQGGEFEFALFEKNGTDPIQTTTNDATGNIKFEDLEFNKADTYHYTIVEKNAGTTDKGITYSNKTIEVTIKVVDNGNGALEATVSYDNNDSTFENTYKADNAKAGLEVMKTLSGRELKADEFDFVLKNDADGSELQKVKNTADGKVTFAPIEYTKAGTYNYTIVETNAGKTVNGVTYDNLEVKVTVEVTDDSEGKLHANVTYSADKEFNNSYGASKAKAALAVKKTLTGRELKADEFEFTLTDQAGTLKETVKNDKDGNVKFSALEFDKAGTFTYKIAEKAGTATGIQYDTKTITATVTVADNGKGVLEATVAYDDEKAFENTYTPAGATTATLGAKKVLEGKALEAGKYSFVLKKEDGSVVETVTNAADGSVTFAPISYDESQVGTHKYTISEVEGDEKGITYDKTVQEVEVTVKKISATELKATASKEAKDLVFKNIYTPAGATTVTLGAKKVLEGKALEAGKYSFVLKKEDGSVVETVTNAADGSVTFSPISYDESQVGTHKYTISEVEGDEKGITYDKTVQEVEVTVKKVSATELKATASKEAKGLVFKNIYTPAKTEVSVKKVWKDADNQDGKRPTSVTVKLLADGQDTGKTLELNKENNWSGSFTDLDVNKAGKAIAYTVIETTKVEGYISEVTGDATSGFTITNSYTPETIDITVTKNWNDADNQDGKRPDKITVNLLADGTKIDSKEVQAATDGTWSVEFTKLAKYKNGKEIKYTVTEEAVAGYKSSIDNFTITNSHDPEKINISGTKVWNDNNDQDGKRPTKITVQVLKGEQVVAEMEVSAETDWKFEFKDLPKYEKGKEITYVLKEVSVEHYTAEVTEKDGKYTITNTHTPAKINVKGQKIWDDANNKDGIRPDSIVVKLLANGVETGKTATASVASGWTYEFTDLDRYQDGGKEIVYTVKEVYVPKGYTSEVTGTNIVNHHKPKDPEPNKPQDPEPNKPKDPEPNKPGKPDPKPQLPNTGEKASNATVVAGLALMAVTGGLYFVSRKNK